MLDTAPQKNAARIGMQITFRFSVTRTGEILGKPKITFETKKATDVERIAYRIAVMSMLQRCTPIPITDALGNAIDGHPLSIRLIDELQQRRAERIERWQTEKGTHCTDSCDATQLGRAHFDSTGAKSRVIT